MTTRLFPLVALLILSVGVGVAVLVMLKPDARENVAASEDRWARQRIEALEAEVRRLTRELDEVRKYNEPAIIVERRTDSDTEPKPVDPSPVAMDVSTETPPAGAAAAWLASLLPDRFEDLSPQEAAFLRELELGGQELTDDDLVRIGDLTHLSKLELGHNAITDAGLLHLQGLTELKRLDLSCTQVTAAGLLHLPRAKLRTLHLNEVALTDHDLGVFQSLYNLESLKLNRIAITDAGMASLGRCTSLQHVELDGTAVTAAGIADLLRFNPNLTRIEARRTVLTPEDLVQLRRDYPNCQIVIDQGGPWDQLPLEVLRQGR